MGEEEEEVSKNLKKAVDATSLSWLAQQPSSHKPLKAALTQTENATAGVARWPVSLVTTLQTILTQFGDFSHRQVKLLMYL